MKVFVTSDLHVDYPANAEWVSSLPRSQYADDLLIVAGDVSDSLSRLAWCLESLRRCFKTVLFVPGNHELWVHREKSGCNSIAKFEKVMSVARDCGTVCSPFHAGRLSIVPLLGWYDHSFGSPSEAMLSSWADFVACRWPAGWTPIETTRAFCQMNEPALSVRNGTVISFSHFLPRIDLMPRDIPQQFRELYPLLGTSLLEQQIRRLGPSIHVYGHSHVNRDLVVNGLRYVNNALAYPRERHISARRLLCIHETTQ